MALGVTILQRTSPPGRGAPTDASGWFIAGEAPSGPTDRSVKLTSLAQFDRLFGDTATDVRNAVDLFFREGGATIHMARAAGASTAAEVTLADADDADSVTVASKYVGASGNALKVAVVAGDADEVVLVVSNAEGELERSPSLALDEIEDWSQNSSYVDVTVVGDEVPEVVVATPLEGGTDDAATDAELVTALALHVGDLGPGQVSIPGKTGATIYNGLAAHAAANNRVFLADVQNTPTVGTITSSASALRNGGLGRHGGLFGPWVKVPTDVAGVQRTVAPSAAVAALITRVDQGGNPNIAAAGWNWPLNYVTDLAVAFSDSDRETLLDAGVSTFKDVYGVLELYGFQTVASQDGEPVFWQLNSSRLLMVISARAKAIGERWMFTQLSKTAPAEFAASIASMLGEYYAVGALYGDTPAEAFRVDWASVNDDESIANGELHAAVELRYSPHAKSVVIELVSTPITSTITA